MSAGKLAAQTAHAVLALAQIAPVTPLMSVVVLTVNEAPFNKAKADNATQAAVVRDAGYTEVEPGTETVIAFLEDDPKGRSRPIT